MFKRIKPSTRVGKIITQFPHCDQRVLHAPAECEFCDKHAEWQELRAAWGIAFTGYEPEGSELPCPATHARGDSVNRWHGNVALPVGIPSADLIPEARTFPAAGVTQAIEKIVDKYKRRNEAGE